VSCGESSSGAPCDHFDLAVAAATERTARTLEAAVASFGLEKVGEIKHMQPAVQAALSAAGVVDVQPSEQTLPLASWEPRRVAGRLGGFDVIVGIKPAYRALFELKWAWSKRELGWTLWDIYKLAAAHVEYGVRTYAIVGAPVSYWND
jgi:hypothetical protein